MSNFLKIQDIYNYRRKVDGDVGLEFEMEGEGLPEIFSNDWISEHDGSLRGESYEYVARQPFKVTEYRKKIADLMSQIKEKATVHNSKRTSVHVHINVRELTMNQLLNYYLLFKLFEVPLLHFCGKSRVGNRFCLPTKK